jgi:hypothetical protein
MMKTRLARSYEKDLRRIARLVKAAAKKRAAMVAMGRKRSRNRSHQVGARRRYNKKEIWRKMPGGFKKILTRLRGTAQGRAALRRYSKFWGLPYPTEIKIVDLPGPKNKTVVLVGMGKTPEVHLADGPKDRFKSRKKVRGSYMAAFDARGRRIFILSGKPSKESKQRLSFVGFAPETHYVPTVMMENAGTFKAGKYWVHKHDDEGGRWPRVRRDQAGNFIYDPATYTVTDWIRR